MSQRKDAKYSKRGVRCPNSSYQGFSRTEAKPGDWIAYREHCTDGSSHARFARVIGRIDAAGTDGPSVKGKVAAIALSDDGTFCYERWIDPADVLSIHSPAPKFLAWFASADPQELLRAADYGAAAAAHTDWNDRAVRCPFPSCPADHEK